MSWQDETIGQLLAGLPNPVLVVDAAGTVVFGNGWAAELFEVELPFPRVSVLELLTQPERSRLNPLAWMARWADAPDAPELDYVFLSCLTRSGKEKQISVRVARYRLDDRAHFIITIHDMSAWLDRLHTERESHRVAARLLSITSDAVLITDADMMITYANASAEKLFGYDPGALLGRTLADLIPARFRDAHVQHVQSFLGDRQPSRLMSERSAVTGLARDGTEVPVQASITRLNRQGSAVYCALLRKRQELTKTVAQTADA